MNETTIFTKEYELVGSASNRIIIELKKAADMLSDAHNIFFKQYNISNTKFNLLYILYNSPSQGVTLSDIGAKMLVTKGNITGLVDRLAKQGYVQRDYHSNDRRKVYAKITDEGKSFTADVIESYKVWSSTIMSFIDDDEKAQLISSLKSLQSELSSISDIFDV